MSEKDSQTNPALYVSIITGFLLTVSEILPYIRNVKANGIIHLITNFLLKKSMTIGNTREDLQQDTEENVQDEERQPLINKRFNTTTHLLSEVSNITITSQNVNFTFHSPNVKLDFNESSK
jgi:hypothetical protein